MINKDLLIQIKRDYHQRKLEEIKNDLICIIDPCCSHCGYNQFKLYEKGIPQVKAHVYICQNCSNLSNMMHK